MARKHINRDPLREIVGTQERSIGDDGETEYFVKDELLECASMRQLFYSNPINVMSLAGNDLKDVRGGLVNFKLETAGKHYGLFPDGPLHNAMVDAELMRSIYNRINYELPPTRENDLKDQYLGESA